MECGNESRGVVAERERRPRDKKYNILIKINICDANIRNMLKKKTSEMVLRKAVFTTQHGEKVSLLLNIAHNNNKIHINVHKHHKMSQRNYHNHQGQYFHIPVAVS